MLTIDSMGMRLVAIRYDKRWKLLIDKKMKKTDLLTKANISTTTLA